MARANVYLPDGLSREARKAGLNLSSLTQEAVRRELAKRKLSAWLRGLERLPRLNVPRDAVLTALDEGREDLGFTDR